MTDKEISGIWEAYQQVHSQVEEVEQLDEDFAGKVDAFLKKGGEVLKKVPGAQAALTPAGPGRKTPTKESGGYRPVVKSVANEEFEQVDEDANYDRNRKRAAQRAAARNEARRQGKTGSVPGVGYVSPRPERETYRDSAGVERHKTGARMPQKEEVDLFDYILEHLVAEGYADTNEAALAIMANMSEEWRQSIVEMGENIGKEPKTVGKPERPGVKGETYAERQKRMKLPPA
jgi:hypothetical protein